MKLFLNAMQFLLLALAALGAVHGHSVELTAIEFPERGRTTVPFVPTGTSTVGQIEAIWVRNRSSSRTALGKRLSSAVRSDFE